MVVASIRSSHRERERERREKGRAGGGGKTTLKTSQLKWQIHETSLDPDPHDPDRQTRLPTTLRIWREATKTRLGRKLGKRRRRATFHTQCHLTSSVAAEVKSSPSSSSSYGGGRNTTRSRFTGSHCQQSQQRSRRRHRRCHRRRKRNAPRALLCW